MKRSLFVLTLMSAALCLTAAESHAGIGSFIGSAKNYITDNILAVVGSVVLASVAGYFGTAYRRIIRTLRETGEFLSVLGASLEDNSLSREEVGGIVREIQDIFSVWTE